MLRQIVQCRATAAPFVEIAHQQGRARVQTGDLIKQGAGLGAARAGQQAKMGGNHPQRLILDHQIGQQRAARLEPRQHQRTHHFDHGAAHQQQVAMPAVRRAIACQRHRDQPEVALQRFQVQQPGAGAEAGVGLLQGHDVGPDFRDHRRRAGKIAPPIRPDTLVDVVGSDRKIVRHHGQFGFHRLPSLLLRARSGKRVPPPISSAASASGNSGGSADGTAR